MKSSLVVRRERLAEQPYSIVVCHPTPTDETLHKRLKELEQLGVRAVEFSGGKHVSNLPVLGKGCVGVVVKAFTKTRTVALKIRRVDADRNNMQHEAKMLTLANTLSIGPRLLDVTENFLVMKFVEGKLFPEWLSSVRSKQRIRNVLKHGLEQCWQLDKAGLDHGELSNAPKHVMIKPDDTPCIVDFETASINRRPSNVTALCQFFFIGGHIAKQVAKKLGKTEETKLKQALKNYKKASTQENFEVVLHAVGLL
ncbi:MAG: serine/threonine protein kinase [Candidatus Bathyarchaeia archaeon]|jgi:putative serine/threonine protein kinase|nr:serine/threonine protein kinase [Candidatus Bathyarchaeota archaeon A05DMB-4]MDH7594977.1 RIO1 family regulatory kinase/ATPase [Candidatus Bathyarchaeota archaeon]